jgi:hypothetical protein
MFARLALILAATLLVSGESRTAEPPQDAIGLILDCQLSKAAENALSKDRELAAYRLKVEVKDQTALLRGKVPDRDTADLAVSRLKRAIPRLKDVKSELTYSGTIVLKLPTTEASTSKPEEGKTGPIRIEADPPPSAPPNAPPRAQPKATPTSREVLAERVAAIQKDSSFARVRVEIHGRLITVYRGATAETASVLAQRLRDLPGIDGVELLD